MVGGTVVVVVVVVVVVPFLTGPDPADATVVDGVLPGAKVVVVVVVVECGGGPGTSGGTFPF